MSEELEHWAAVPVELEMRGRVYRLAPLTVAQYAELVAWARRLPYAELEADLAAIENPELRKLAQVELIREAARASRDPLRIAMALGSPECCKRAARVALKANHPELTDEAAAELVGALEVDRLAGIVDRLVTLGAKGDKKADRKNG